MTVLALLCGVLSACAAYFVLARAVWQRLLGLMLLGNALAMLVIAGGGGSPASIRISVAVSIAAFALFLGLAALIGGGTALHDEPDEEGRP